MASQSIESVPLTKGHLGAWVHYLKDGPGAPIHRWIPAVVVDFDKFGVTVRWYEDNGLRKVLVRCDPDLLRWRNARRSNEGPDQESKLR